MKRRHKGHGYISVVSLLGCFILFRLLFGDVFHESGDTLRRHTNGAALACAGVISLLFAIRLDRKSGIDPFSWRSWTTELFVSQHLLLELPLRLIAVIFIAASFLF